MGKLLKYYAIHDELSYYDTNLTFFHSATHMYIYMITIHTQTYSLLLLLLLFSCLIKSLMACQGMKIWYLSSSEMFVMWSHKGILMVKSAYVHKIRHAGQRFYSTRCRTRTMTSNYWLDSRQDSQKLSLVQCFMKRKLCGGQAFELELQMR